MPGLPCRRPIPHPLSPTWTVASMMSPVVPLLEGPGGQTDRWWGFEASKAGEVLGSFVLTSVLGRTAGGWGLALGALLG